MINESKIVKEIQKDENIRYFKLPEDNGWNSGRAVLISQVQTEYFVTCDDDFVFKDTTRTGMHDNVFGGLQGHRVKNDSSRSK